MVAAAQQLHIVTAEEATLVQRTDALGDRHTKKVGYTR